MSYTEGDEPPFSARMDLSSPMQQSSQWPAFDFHWITRTNNGHLARSIAVYPTYRTDGTANVPVERLVTEETCGDNGHVDDVIVSRDTLTLVQRLGNRSNPPRLRTRTRVRLAITTIRNRWDDFIDPWFPGMTNELRSVMHVVGACATGSVVLGYLYGSHAREWNYGDLDIVVPATPYNDEVSSVQVFAAFLRVVGYDLTTQLAFYDRPFEAATRNSHISMVFKFTHPVTGRKIDVLQGRTDQVVDVICGFHSTAVMNMVTAHHVVVLYPTWTARHISLANVHAVTPAVRAKYASRGVSMAFDTTLGRPCGADCPAIQRRIPQRPDTDECWVARLSMDATQLTPTEVSSERTWRAPMLCTNLQCPNFESMLPHHNNGGRRLFGDITNTVLQTQENDDSEQMDIGRPN